MEGEVQDKVEGDFNLTRYGMLNYLMDEILHTKCRSIKFAAFCLIWQVTHQAEIGRNGYGIVQEWFQVFAQKRRHICMSKNLYGENNHHIVEHLKATASGH